MISKLGASLREAAGRISFVPPLLAAVAVAIHAIPSLASVLEYDRGAILGGEWWRIVTGAWTHFSVDHLAWDAGTFAVLGTIVAMRDRRAFWAVTIGSAVLYSILLLVFSPGVAVYRGLSGIDSGLFTLVAVGLLLERTVERRWGGVAIAGAVILGFLGKVAYELATGATLFVDSAAAGMTPLPMAHAAGAAVGLAACLARIPKRQTDGAPPASIQLEGGSGVRLG